MFPELRTAGKIGFIERFPGDIKEAATGDLEAVEHQKLIFVANGNVRRAAADVNENFQQTARAALPERFGNRRAFVHFQVNEFAFEMAFFTVTKMPDLPNRVLRLVVVG